MQKTLLLKDNVCLKIGVEVRICVTPLLFERSENFPSYLLLFERERELSRQCKNPRSLVLEMALRAFSRTIRGTTVAHFTVRAGARTPDTVQF